MVLAPIIPSFPYWTKFKFFASFSYYSRKKRPADKCQISIILRYFIAKLYVIIKMAAKNTQSNKKHQQDKIYGGL